MNRRTLDSTSSPLAALAVQLRRSRESKGLTQVALGRLVRYSNAYISNTETAKEPPSLRFVQAADSHLETGGSLELLWWSWKNGSLIPGFPEYATEEGRAAVLRIFKTEIHGLFQTQELATALEAGHVRRGTATRAEADARVGVLLARQGLFDRTPTPTVHAVLDESSLRRPIGGPAVMARQLRHLEEVAQHPRIIIQVCPFSLAENRPFTHSITLLTMPNGAMIGYTETEQRGYLERDSDTVRAWDTNHDLLQVESLSQAASLALIRDVRKDYETSAS